MTHLRELSAIFAQLSLLAFGGGNAVLPEMQRQVVTVQHWMSAPDFAALYALAQAAPGPNMLVATLIGWQVAGLTGALTATAAMIAPSSVLTFVCAHIWNRLRTRTWQARIQAGLTPVTAGLVMAGAAMLVRTTAGTSSRAVLIVAATSLFTLTRINPLPVLALAAAGAALGWLD